MVAKFTFFQLLFQKYEEEKWIFTQNDPRRQWENFRQGKRNGQFRPEAFFNVIQYLNIGKW